MSQKPKIPSISSSNAARQPQIHKKRQKVSKSKLAKSSTNRPPPRPKFQPFLFLSLPPKSIFPTLTGIRTLSNTRIDNLKQGSQQNNNDGVAAPDEDGATTTPTFDPGELKTTIMTRDCEFSYDYETYMMHVTGCGQNYDNRVKKWKYDKITNGSSYKGWMGNEDSVQRNLTNSSFGLNLLDLSESLVVRICINPTPVVELAFRKSGTIPFGPVYEVSTKSGSPMLYMTETTNCWNRLLSCSWIGCNRLFMAQIVDVCGKLAMTVNNSGLDCCCCCCRFCCCSWFTGNSREFRVNLASGDLLGTICQTRGDECNPGFLLRDSELQKLMHANGPKFRIFDKLSTFLSVMCCCFSCLIDDDVFYFTEHGGKRVAEIRKVETKGHSNYSDSGGGSGGGGIDPEEERSENDIPGDEGDVADDMDQDEDDLDFDYLDYAPNYEIIINFAPNLSLRKKCLILSASLIIDFLYWQSAVDSYYTNCDKHA